MNLIKKVGIMIGMVAAVITVAFITLGTFAKASSPYTVPAVVATSSTMSVGTSSVATLFTSNSVCTSRIISTVSQPIMLSFSSDITPTATVGHVQAASTTVIYDASLYGCGQVTAYGYPFSITAIASTTITKTELR